MRSRPGVRHAAVRCTAITALSLGLLLAAGSLGSAHQFLAGDLLITHPRAGATAADATPGVGYVVIENQGVADDRLVGAESQAADRVELHRTVFEDGVARMRPAPEGLAIPAGEIVELAPGGFHLMLMGLDMPLVAGERLPLTLIFNSAGAVSIELAIE